MGSAWGSVLASTFGSDFGSVLGSDFVSVLGSALASVSAGAGFGCAAIVVGAGLVLVAVFAGWLLSCSHLSKAETGEAAGRAEAACRLCRVPRSLTVSACAVATTASKQNASANGFMEPNPRPLTHPDTTCCTRRRKIATRELTLGASMLHKLAQYV